MRLQVKVPKAGRERRGPEGSRSQRRSVAAPPPSVACDAPGVTRGTGWRGGASVVLVTGFEAFGGEAVNPSAEIARRLHGETIAGHCVVGAVLPCVFGRSSCELRRLIRRLKPALVISVGQAGGRSQVTPERIAINVDDARIADNAGRQPVDAAVVRGGPVAYLSTLPIKAIVAELARAGIPAAVSQSAGTFVCNHVFYALMHELARRPGIRGGFIHVPFLPEQTSRKLERSRRPPSLRLEVMTEAIRRSVEVSILMRRDVRAAGGQIP